MTDPRDREIWGGTICARCGRAECVCDAEEQWFVEQFIQWHNGRASADTMGTHEVCGCADCHRASTLLGRSDSGRPLITKSQIEFGGTMEKINEAGAAQRSNVYAMAPAIDGSSPSDILIYRRLTIQEAAWLSWQRASDRTWDAMWWWAGWNEVGHA